MATGTEETQSDTENSADLQQSTAELVQKHKRRGRPKGSRNKPEDETSSEVANKTAVDPAVVQANLALVEATVTSIVGAADGIVCRKIATRAARLGAPKEFQDDCWRSVGLTKSEVEVVAKCSSTIVARHDILLRYAPECMLACVLASYSVRVLTVVKRLDEMETRLRADAAKAKEPLA